MLLGLLHLPLEPAVADLLVADELDVADLDLRALVDVEGHLGQLGTAGERFDARFDLGELMAPSRPSGRGRSLRRGGRRADRGTNPAQRDAGLLHLLVDLRAIDLVGGQ